MTLPLPPPAQGKNIRLHAFGKEAATDESSQLFRAKNSVSRFDLLPFDQIKWTATAEYLVKGILPVTGLVLIYGAPKCGKSFWAYDLGMHVARGLDYRGKRVRMGAVVYLAAEGGHGFKKRVEAYRQHNDCSEAQFHLCTVRPDLAADKDALISDIRAQIGSDNPAVIFVDTVNRTLQGSESKDADMARYLAAAAALEDEFKCCVVLIHHCGLEKGRPRGHTSLTAAVDVQIAVERDSAENILATIELAKDGEAGEQFVSRLKQIEIGRDDEGDAVTSCIVVPVDEPQVQKKAPGKTLKPEARLALKLLANVVCDHGEANIPGVPNGLKAVPLKVWHEACDRGGVIDKGGTKEAQRQARHRIRLALRAAEKIGVQDDYVWLAGATT